MGLLDKLFGRRKKEEAKVLKALEKLDTAKTEEKDLEGLENVDDLEKQWLQRRSGNGGAEPKGYGEEQGEDEEKEEDEEGEEKEEFSDDDLIASLREKEENEELEEMDPVIKNVMEEVGNVRAQEILELGREVLNDMSRGSKY
jgi:hypothetical protein